MENELKDPFQNGYNKGLGFGIILMVIGLLFLTFNFGLLPSSLKSVVFSWPMLLIVIGLVNFLKRKLFPSLVLFMIGIFFIIPKIVHAFPDYFPGINGNFTHIYWPLILILAGLMLIISRTYGPKWGFPVFNKHHYYGNKNYRYQSKWEGEINNDPTVGFSKNAVFGSGEHIVLDPEFKGGDINAVFGGIKLDLRRTNLVVGETRLEVNAVFGGVSIYVPNDWYIETHIDAVFGGFEDKRMLKEPTDTTRKLIITGSCVFGGGELMN